MWADTPDKWDRVLRVLDSHARHGVPGLDCEFDGCDITAESPVAKSRLVCWSVAVMTERISPLGHREADGVALTREAAFYPPMRAWLESDAPKATHNAGAEVHTFGNEGIWLGGVINTLTLARWMEPGRLLYGADALGEDFLGRGKTADFKDFVEPVVVDKIRTHKVKRCECGAVPCRKQSKNPGHTRVEVVEETFESTVEMRPVPIRHIVPGHPLFAKWEEYMIRDAVIAAEVHHLFSRMKIRDENPWAYLQTPAKTGSFFD